MERRSWTQHLRLLPGGEADVGSALVATGVLYLTLLAVGTALALALHQGAPSVGPFTWFGLANALPCAVIALWTGMRVRTSKHIGLDEAAADLERARVFFGDEVSRVPERAVVLSIRPRQVSVPMADGRRLTVFYRINADPGDLLELARLLHERSAHGALTADDYVHEVVSRGAKELLPDPEGIRQALAEQLLRQGVVLTRAEVS